MSWVNQWNVTERPIEPNPLRPAKGNRAPNAFGPTLAAFRHSRNLSQSRLAEKTGFDHSYVSRLESGVRTPSWDAVIAFATVLELPPEDQNRLLAAAGFLPDDLSGVIDPLAIDVQRVLIAVKGTTAEQTIREMVGLILKAAA